MKNRLLLLLLFSLLLNVIDAQNRLGKTDDIERIVIKTYADLTDTEIPVPAQKAVVNKLSQIATNYGMGGSPYANSQFVITADIITYEKSILSTAPIKFAVDIEMTIYIGNIANGSLVGNELFQLKGVGNTETKAYMSAIRSLSVRDRSLSKFIEQSKNKIISYYNDNCDFIIKRGETLAGQQRYDEAISVLSEIPEVCKECFEKVMDSVVPIYKEKINKECKEYIMSARNLWYSTQSVEAAREALDILSMINPSADCFNEAYNLSKDIGEKVKALNEREYNLLIKEKEHEWQLLKQTQNNELELRKVQIKAMEQARTDNQRIESEVLKSLIRGWISK